MRFCDVDTCGGFRLLQPRPKVAAGKITDLCGVICPDRIGRA